MWDAGQYLRFGGERARPFFDLVAQIGATDPRHVVDLGCGPGNLTAALAQRWPGATVTGMDNSPEMINAATAAVLRGGLGGSPPRASWASAAQGARNLAFAIGDVRDWHPEHPVDVIVCNAVLQWVPGHDELLPRWAAHLAPGGWLAFQLPGNFDQPSHAIVAEMAASPRWRGLLAGAELNRQAGDPADYVALLARPGFEVDAWETSYLHVLHGENPVLEWTKGTTLRPVLAGLDEEQAAAFLGEYGERVRDAYHPQPFGTLFPFRRVFAVVHRT
ncbi:MAG TPA: trans-aconitate 2-methyltransferase [Trebonia sp.]|nr:trans-aconitate 2-methyltransferase [Trebonia sp.]